MIHYSLIRNWKSPVRSLVLTVAAFLLFAPSVEGQLSLREAANRALATNPGLRGAELTVEARSEAVHAARGLLLPQVDLNAALTYLDKDLVLNLDPIRDAMISIEAGDQEAIKNLESLLVRGRPLSEGERAAITGQVREQMESGLPHFQETLKDQSFLQGVVTVRQPIFAGGKILAGIRAAQAQEDGAHAARDSQRGAVLAEAAQRYLDVLLATEYLRLREEAERTLLLHRERAERLMEEGVIAAHEKIRADVAVADAERAAFNAREHLRIAQVALVSSLGEDDPHVPLADTLLFYESPLSLNQALESFEESNPTLQQLRAGTEALEEKARARRADYFPTIYGFGMYNLFDRYMVEGAEPKWAVGIGVSFSLFDGLRRTHEWEEARLDASALGDRTAETQRKLRLFLQNAVMQMELAREQYLQLTAVRSQAEENLRLNSRRFDEGLGTSLEVIDARLSLDAVLLQRSSALHSFYSRQLDVFEVIGGVDPFIAHWDSNQQKHD